MADIYGTTNNEYIQSCISWSYTSSVENNQSTVTADLWYRRTNTGYTTYGTGSFSLMIDGKTKTYSGSVSIGTGWVKVMTYSVTVDHADDGSKSIKLSATGGIPGTSFTSTTCSDTVTLTPIARASVPTVSATSVTMVKSVTITTNRKSTSFTHDLSYSFGGSTGTIATDVGDSYAWTVPDLVSKIPNKASETCTITCKTKNGTTVIGTKTVTLTLSIPEKSTVSASGVQMGKSTTISIARKSTGFTHKLTYAIGGTSGTIGDEVTTSKTWTPPKSLANYTGKKLSAECTITCTTYNGTYKVGDSTAKITLTVPNATVPTLSDAYPDWGDEITISMPRETDAYVHDLYYELKAYGSDTVVASGTFSVGVGESSSWTDSAKYAKMIPSATKGVFTITCTTRFKDSETIVGSNSVSYTETVPNDTTTQPKVTAMSISPVDAFNGLYLSGKSKVGVSYTASSDYSDIASYETTINGTTGNGTSYTSPVLYDTGTVTITGKVTDKRGYSTTVTKTITVIDYKSPRVVPASGSSRIICARCNSDGTLDPGGVYLCIKLGRSFSKVLSGNTQYNFCKISYQWKTDGATEYSQPVELLAKSGSSDVFEGVLSGIVSSTSQAYDIQLIAEDDVGGTDTVTIIVPTVFATWHIPAGGHGFTLGGYHDPSKYNVFDCRFDAEFQGNVIGGVIGLGVVPAIYVNENINDYKNFGVYSVRLNETAETIQNLPVKKAGTLRVWSSVGNGKNSGAHAFIIQEYISYDNTGIYRRCVRSTEDKWIYEDWKTIFSG